MSFTTAAIIVVASAAIALALICYHLLARLEVLERAVIGGLGPPSYRLGREEYELRFATALLRSRLAAAVVQGVVVGLAGPSDDLVAVLRELARPDGVVVAGIDRDTTERIGSALGSRFEAIALDRFEVSPPTLPYLWIVDEGRISTAQPIAGPDDLLRVLVDRT